MAVTWRRAASSGTTPPWHLWRSYCDDTTEDRTRRPPETTAADVSSHDVSMPSTIAAFAHILAANAQPSCRSHSPCLLWEWRHTSRRQAIAKAPRERGTPGFDL